LSFDFTEIIKKKNKSKAQNPDFQAKEELLNMLLKFNQKRF